MTSPIELKNTDILLKYINCVERVLFIDNKWMGEYQDILSNLEKEYKGVPLFLKKILESLNEKGLSIFKESLPERESIKKWKGDLPCIVLESLSHLNYIREGSEDQQYVVVACPTIEKIFHFKVNKPFLNYFLKEAKINDFYYHPHLPRIKIYSKNFVVSENLSKLTDLKFLYTLPSDANKLIKSYKKVNEKISWDELVPDPAYGVQIGNLGIYCISPIKIVEVKRDIENIREQIILIGEDFLGEKHKFCMKPLDYKKIVGEFPEEKILEEPFYLRALIFQGFAENFRHILQSDKISKNEFQEDSAFSYIRFRKVISKEKFPVKLNQIPLGIEEKDNFYYYFPKGFSNKMFDAKEKFNSKEKFATSFLDLKKYHEFQNLCRLHPGWEEVYTNKLDASGFYHPLKILYPTPWGVHRDFLRDPSYKLRFYTKNKLSEIFCPDCKKFQKKIKIKDIPKECPICNCKGLISLDKKEDFNLFFKENNNLSNSEETKLKEYYRLSSLFTSFYRYLYYTLNFTGYSLDRCVDILNRTRNLFNQEELFFDNLFKIKSFDNRRYDIVNILYQIEKNEG